MTSNENNKQEILENRLKVRQNSMTAYILITTILMAVIVINLKEEKIILILTSLYWVYFLWTHISDFLKARAKLDAYLITKKIEEVEEKNIDK